MFDYEPNAYEGGPQGTDKLGFSDRPLLPRFGFILAALSMVLALARAAW